MKPKCIALAVALACVTSCAFHSYSPRQVEAAKPPYRTPSQIDYVEKRLREGVVPEDWRITSTGGVCEVHKIAMATVVSTMTSELVSVTWPREHSEAKARYFPHSGNQAPLSLYSKRVGKVYVCPKCVTASHLWPDKEG